MFRKISATTEGLDGGGLPLFRKHAYFLQVISKSILRVIDAFRVAETLSEVKTTSCLSRCYCLALGD